MEYEDIISSDFNTEFHYIVIYKSFPYNILYTNGSTTNFIKYRRRIVFPFTKLHFKIKKIGKQLSQGSTGIEIKRNELLNDILK
jgi:hypothetical protein